MKLNPEVLKEIEDNLQEYVSEFFEWHLGNREALAYDDSWNGEIVAQDVDCLDKEDKKQHPHLKFRIMFSSLPAFAGKGSYMTIHLCEGPMMHKVLMCKISEFPEGNFNILKEYDNLHLISSKIFQ